MLSEQFLNIIDALKSGNIHKIKQSIDHFLKVNSSDLFTSIEFKSYKEKIEEEYYRALSKFLAKLQFKNFKKLFNYSDKLEIFLDVKKIPNRFRIILELHIDGIQTGQTGRIFDIIRFFNEYNLFEKDFIQEEEKLIETLKKDKILVENLRDLFGSISNSLIYYACKIIPYDLYLLFANNTNPDVLQQNFFFLREWINRFPMYGFAVENLGSPESFFEAFEEAYKNEKNKLKIEDNNGSKKDLKLIEFHFPRNKKHLVSPNILLKIKSKVLNKNSYVFYNLSMVLIGGLGPQGHGFTYSTPRGEVIEICSDLREQEAIIVEYKQFLKRQFLSRLKKRLSESSIDETINDKIINYLNKELKPNEVINYFKKNIILKQLITFFNESQSFSIHKDEYFEIITSISNAITIILRKIKLEDQFKTRVDLIDNNKVKSEELAKLTNLRGKSHYDILRERMFFQNEIKWFYRDYTTKILKLREGL